MVVSDIVEQSLRNLRANKLRTVLTMMGIIWGIAAVIVLLSFGLGLRSQYRDGLTKIGNRIIFIFGRFTSSGVGGYKAGRSIRFTSKDVEAIKARCPAVELAVPASTGMYVVKHGIESRTIEVRGVVPESKYIRNFDIKEGRFFIEEDNKRALRFCILGDVQKKRFFAEKNDVIGEKIKIKGMSFTVIGLLKGKGEQMGVIGNSEDDELILVPLTTSLNLLSGSKYLWNIQVQPYSLEDSEKAEEQVREVLADLHNFSVDDKDALMIFNMAENVIMLNTMSLALNIFLGVVSVITLFIGGVGVMNIMLVSVAERTREIGVRRSLGAKKKDVLKQFIAEALVMTFMGGIMGFLVGAGICIAVSHMALPDNFPRPELSPIAVLISVIVMIAVGLFSGTIPANQAAKLDPVEALRY